MEVRKDSTTPRSTAVQLQLVKCGQRAIATTRGLTTSAQLNWSSMYHVSNQCCSPVQTPAGNALSAWTVTNRCELAELQM